MFVVFEGIDGSGKTTVSNQVADGLRARGITVEHVRENGEFASPLVGRMREFGKDPRNLAMTPLAELLYYTARETQLLDEAVRPSLGLAQLVFADRFLYSCEVLAVHGRGVPEAQVRPVIDAAAGGLWPDLVVLMDADPYVARARRKVTKIRRKAKGEELGPGSRKGLWGVGLQHRMRAGYLELAARDPGRWLIVDNADPRDPDAALDAVVARLTDALADIVSGSRTVAEVAGGAARGAPELSGSPRSNPDGRRSPTGSGAGRPAAMTPPPDADLAWGRDAFYDEIEARAVREPKTAAYFLAGLDDDRAYELRERLRRKARHVIAYGLRGLGDDRAWALREELVRVSPRQIARSLDGAGVAGPRADEMRAALADDAPAVVLATISGEDSEAAWALRERFADSYLARVVGSLKRLDSERAWAVREDYLRHISAHRLGEDPRATSPLAVSLRGLAGERSWALRRRFLDVCPTTVIGSLAGVDGDEAWALRERLARQAPKLVLRTIEGDDSPRAWTLRRTHAPVIKEALDSMIGLDSEPAWALREACRDVWPSTVVKSLGALGVAGRGRRLARELLVRHPDNISLLKHAARLSAIAAAAEAGAHAGSGR